MTDSSHSPSPALSTAQLERRILDAIRRGASMADIAALRHHTDIQTPAGAIEALKDGNARFFSGKSGRPELDVNERRAQIMGQTPYAAVLACSDSRVPVELVFDVGLGDLFVVRVAGNVVGETGLGTLEYAIEHLDVHLVMVMGHESCGAVAAALLSPEEIAREPENIQSIIRRITPSLVGLPRIRDKKARMREAVLNNVRHQVHFLREQSVIRAAEARGQVQVIGGYYEIGSGAVDFLIDEADLLP